MYSKELFNGFEGKKVLICGASGLTGHNLFDMMEVLGAKVTGTCFSNQDFYTDGEKVFKQVDFTVAREVHNLVSTDAFDFVFLCAAQTYNAQVCKDNPQCLILPNLTMVSNVLEASLQNRVSKVMYVSSATVYQPHNKPIAETELNLNKNPHNIYMGIGWVKRYLEKLCEFYSARGLKTIIVRPTNIYGRYDKTDETKCHVLPAFIMRALREENPFIIKSLGDGIKNFIHVNDLTRDMAKAMLTDKNFDVFNLTSDEYFSIGQVVDLVIKSAKQIKPDYNPNIRHEGYPDVVSFVGLNREKFDKVCGRETYIPLVQGISEVMEWFFLSLRTQNA